MRALAIILLSFISCHAFAQSDGYIKGEKGTEYKIISTGSGDLIKPGDFAAFYFTSVYSGATDTILNNSYDNGVPQIFRIKILQDQPDTSAIAENTEGNDFGEGIPAEYYSIFIQLRYGDSASVRMLSDSIFKKYPESMPPFIKKGHYLYNNLKIAATYSNYAEASIAKKIFDDSSAVFLEKKAKQQALTDEFKLTDYFLSKSIAPKKTPKGAYILMKSPGIGLPLDKQCVVKINYTGRTLAGEVFDSNTNASKGHTEPLSVNLTDDPANGSPVIEGLKDALFLMKDKSKATIYIPSGLAYGNRQAGELIHANENLIFDVEVLSVKRIPAKGRPAPAKKTAIKKPIRHK